MCCVGPSHKPLRAGRRQGRRYARRRHHAHGARAGFDARSGHHTRDRHHPVCATPVHPMQGVRRPRWTRRGTQRLALPRHCARVRCRGALAPAAPSPVRRRGRLRRAVRRLPHRPLPLLPGPEPYEAVRVPMQPGRGGGSVRPCSPRQPRLRQSGRHPLQPVLHGLGVLVSLEGLGFAVKLVLHLPHEAGNGGVLQLTTDTLEKVGITAPGTIAPRQQRRTESGKDPARAARRARPRSAHVRGVVLPPLRSEQFLDRLPHLLPQRHVRLLILPTVPAGVIPRGDVHLRARTGAASASGNPPPLFRARARLDGDRTARALAKWQQNDGAEQNASSRARTVDARAHPCSLRHAARLGWRARPRQGVRRHVSHTGILHFMQTRTGSPRRPGRPQPRGPNTRRPRLGRRRPALRLPGRGYSTRRGTGRSESVELIGRI